MKTYNLIACATLLVILSFLFGAMFPITHLERLCVKGEPFKLSGTTIILDCKVINQ